MIRGWCPRRNKSQWLIDVLASARLTSPSPILHRLFNTTNGPRPKNLFLSIPPPCVRPTPVTSRSTLATVLMPHHHGTQYVSDEDDDDDEGTVIYSRTSSSASLRSRFVVTKICEPKTITTTPGLLGAGETETESEDQPVRVCLASILRCQSFGHSCGSSQQPASSPPPGHWSLQPRYNSASRHSSFHFLAGYRLFQPSSEHCTTSSVPYLLHNLPVIGLTLSFQSYGCVIYAFCRVYSFANAINRRS